MEEHAHFKPNIHLLSSRSGNSSVYSVLSNPQNESHSTHFNPPSLFSNNVRHEASSISVDSRIERLESGHPNSSNLTFPTMSGRNQDHNSTGNHVADSYSTSTGGLQQQRSQQQNAHPPTIFSASLNSANLLSPGGSNEESSNLSVTHSHSSHQEKPIEPTTPGSGRYSNSINITSSSLSSSVPSTNTSTGQHYTQSGSSGNQLTYSQTSSQVQYTQSGAVYQTSGSSMISVDGSQVSGGQPTYVLLQAPNETDSNGQPQVFLAMQTAGIPGQDSSHQPYITLQPVSVDGSELSNNTIVQEGVTLQQAVMHQSNASDLPSDSKSSTSENEHQVVLNIPSQQSLMPSSNSNGPLVTYLQPLGNIGVPVSNMEQGHQVIMASSDLQGNLTLHNVGGIGNRKNVLSNSRQSTQSTSLATPRRRLSTDPRSCEQCGRTFKYPSDLKKHLQIHTDIKKFQCEDCNRAFRRLHQLNVHRRIHTGEKPYVCNRCSAQFRHDSTLTMHIRTRHDHLKPFTCDGCSKKFGRMSHLRKHQRNVCGRSSLRGSIAQCKYCDAVFQKKADLKAHFPLCEKKPDRVEKDVDTSPQVRFKCDTCGKLFTRIYDYKRHQMSHSDEKPYGCPQCGKMFKERSSLNKHVKRMHCSEGDGTIPIEDDGIIAGDDDDEEDEDEELSVDENDNGLSITNITSGGVKAIFTQSNIMDSNQVVTANGQTISATEILNFPEVAEALGINTGAHTAVLDTDGNSTMITITQPGNLETSEVSMDIDQNMIQDGTIIVTDTPEETSGHYITNEQLGQIAPVQVDGDNIDGNDEIHVIYNPENNDNVTFSSSGESLYTSSLASTMVFKRESGETFIKREDDIADHVKAEQAAAHDLQPEDEQSVLLEE